MRNELFLPLLLESYFTSSPTEKMDLFEHFWHLNLNQNLVTWSLPIYFYFMVGPFLRPSNSRSLLELTENTEESYGYIHSLLNEYQLTFSPQIILHFEYSWNEINSSIFKKKSKKSIFSDPLNSPVVNFYRSLESWRLMNIDFLIPNAWRTS